MTLETLNATATSAVALDTDAVYGGSARERLPVHMPLFVLREQAYYWSFEWQQDIRESLAALEDGDYEDFDSDDPNDVARWFLSGRD
jgi:hypothetical protein